MQRIKGMQVAAAVVLAMASSGAMAQSVYSFKSANGDYIGQGQSKVYTDGDSRFTVSGSPQSLTVAVSNADDWWYLTFAAPRGETLKPGRYYNVERASFRTGRSAGLDVSGNGRGCNDVWGSLFVRQFELDPAGGIARLEASFVQRCGSASAPVLAGTVRHQVEPLYLSLSSGAGDYVGQGVRRTYYGDTSTFVLTGDASRFSYGASGQRDDWMARIAAPTGQRLAKGRYATARFADTQRAGLDFSGNGRGCNASSGELDVRALETDPVSGAVTSLYATFVQYCDASTVPLKGTIRYHR